MPGPECVHVALLLPTTLPLLFQLLAAFFGPFLCVKQLWLVSLERVSFWKTGLKVPKLLADPTPLLRRATPRFDLGVFLCLRLQSR
jgi:hypothetical protein